jgi:ABC-type cobalt transport system substrate-binding protein
MSPLNECKKENEKLQRQLKSLRQQLELERANQDRLIRLSAKEKLHTVMYSSMFKSVLSSIEEDLENARTAKEAKEWVTEIIERFKPAFDPVNTDKSSESEVDSLVDRMGIEFDKQNLRLQFDSLYAEMKQVFSAGCYRG